MSKRKSVQEQIQYAEILILWQNHLIISLKLLDSCVSFSPDALGYAASSGVTAVSQNIPRCQNIV